MLHHRGPRSCPTRNDKPSEPMMTPHGDSPNGAGGGDCHWSLPTTAGTCEGRSARRISHPTPPDHYRDDLLLVCDKVGIDRHYDYYISTA